MQSAQFGLLRVDLNDLPRGEGNTDADATSHSRPAVEIPRGHEVSESCFRMLGGKLLRSGTGQIGRHSECDVRLACATVSRRQLEYRRSDEVMWVKEKGSGNGTYIVHRPLGGAPAITIVDGRIQPSELQGDGVLTLFDIEDERSIVTIAKEVTFDRSVMDTNVLVNTLGRDDEKVILVTKAGGELVMILDSHGSPSKMPEGPGVAFRLMSDECRLSLGDEVQLSAYPREYVRLRFVRVLPGT